MLALANGDRTCGVRAAVFGGRAQHLAIDVGRTQFQRRTDNRHRPQHISAVGLGFGLEAAAAEDPRKAFADSKRSPQTGRLQPIRLSRIERQCRTRRTGEMTEDFGQTAASNIKGLDRVVLLHWRLRRQGHA
ncbi:hypothetical protein D9M71_703850 [compost metagenome]